MGKRFFFWIIFFLSLTTMGMAKEMTVAYFLSYGHIGIDHGTNKVQGPLVELLNAYIGPEMGVAFTWQAKPSNVPRIISSMEHNRVDLTPLLVYTRERAKKMRFTDKPYYWSQSALVVPKDSNLTAITRLEDILEITIGYAKGTYISPFMRDPRVRFEMNSIGNYMVSNMKKVQRGRIDAAYAPDKVGLLKTIMELGMEKELRCINLPEERVPFYVVFSATDAADDWVAKYNAAFDKLKADKLYLRLLSKHLDTSQL